MLVAERKQRRRLSIRMGTKHHRAAFGRAVSIQHTRVRHDAMDFVEQSLAGRRRAHAQTLHRRQVGRRHRLLVVEHHGDHRRHRCQPGAFEAADRIDISLHLELRHQHHAGVTGQHELRQSQRVHVIERRRDQSTVVLDGTIRKPRFDHPALRVVGQDHALGTPGGPGRIKEGRWLVLHRNHSLERTGIDESGEVRLVEIHHLDIVGNDRATLLVTEDERGARVFDDVVDDVARQAMIDRHRHEAGPHDAEMRGKTIGTVRGQDRNPISALVAAFRQSAGDAVSKRIERCVGDFPAVGTIKIDDRDLVHRARAIDQCSKIR